MTRRTAGRGEGLALHALMHKDSSSFKVTTYVPQCAVLTNKHRTSQRLALFILRAVFICASLAKCSLLGSDHAPSLPRPSAPYRGFYPKPYQAKVVLLKPLLTLVMRLVRARTFTKWRCR